MEGWKIYAVKGLFSMILLLICACVWKPDLLMTAIAVLERTRRVIVAICQIGMTGVRMISTIAGFLRNVSGRMRTGRNDRRGEGSVEEAANTTTYGDPMLHLKLVKEDEESIGSEEGEHEYADETVFCG